MIFASALLLTVGLTHSAPTARDALKDALDHYKGLRGLSMTIRNHDASGLFPGDFTQVLRWRKGGPFEMVVTKKASPKPAPPGLAAPNYYCADGVIVTILWPDRPRETMAVNHDLGSVPGWEVSGGVILSELLRSPMVGQLLDPPHKVNAKWAFGATHTWEGERVRDVVITWNGGGVQAEYHVYLSASGHRIVGTRLAPGRGSKGGWSHFMKQVENPSLPQGLGNAPK